MKKYLYLSLSIIETALLIYLSVQPYKTAVMKPLLPMMRSGDIEHFLAYSIYAMLLINTSRAFNKSERYFLFFGLIIASFTEAVQTIVPNRYGELMDMLINYFGLFIGTIFMRLPLFSSKYEVKFSQSL